MTMTNSTKKSAEPCYVRWKGVGPHTFPFPPGREIELRPGDNEITEGILHSITGGLGTDNRAKGGSAAVYWNAPRPLLFPSRAPLAGEPCNRASSRVGITKSRRSRRRASEDGRVAALEAQLAALQLQISGLAGGAAPAPIAAPDPGSTAGPDNEALLRESEARRTRQAKEIDRLRGKIEEAASLEGQLAEAQAAERTAREEAAAAIGELDEATAPAPALAIDPAGMTIKQLEDASRGADPPALVAALQAEFKRPSGARTGAVSALTKAINGGV